LGIDNLETFGSALHIQWLWARPWAGLPIQVPGKAQALFDVAVEFFSWQWRIYSFLVRSVAEWKDHH